MKITAAQAITACRKIIADGKAKQKAAADAVKAAQADLDRATTTFLKEVAILLRGVKHTHLKSVSPSYRGTLSLDFNFSDTPESRELVDAIVDVRKPYSDCLDRLQAANATLIDTGPHGRYSPGTRAYHLRTRVERAERALKILSLLDPDEKVSLGSVDFRFILEGLS